MHFKERSRPQDRTWPTVNAEQRPFCFKPVSPSERPAMQYAKTVGALHNQPTKNYCANCPKIIPVICSKLVHNSPISEWTRIMLNTPYSCFPYTDYIIYRRMKFRQLREPIQLVTLPQKFHKSKTLFAGD